MVAVSNGTARTEFVYDGLHRIVVQKEYVSSTLVEETKIVWCGSERCEERVVSGPTRKLFAHGEGSEPSNS